MNADLPHRRAQIQHLHQLYCRCTGQTLSLGFDRERLWYEFLRAGFTAEDLAHVLRYLQREVRHQRRYVGALKRSNLLQLDRFEEDLNISRVRLQAPAAPSPAARAGPTCSPAQQQQGRERALVQLRELQAKLRQGLI